MCRSHEKDEIPDFGKIENRRSVLMGQAFASFFFIPFLRHTFPCSWKGLISEKRMWCCGKKLWKCAAQHLVCRISSLCVCVESCRSCNFSISLRLRGCRSRSRRYFFEAPTFTDGSRYGPKRPYNCVEIVTGIPAHIGIVYYCVLLYLYYLLFIDNY